MSGLGKDSAEVVRFMSLFARLRDWIDDDPGSIAALANDDGGLRKLCSDVYWAGHLVQMEDRRHPQLFAAPSDPRFIEVFRHFEDRYQSLLACIWLSDLLPETDLQTSSGNSQADQNWDFAQEEAAETVDNIRTAIDFCRLNADQDYRWDEGQQDLISRVREGVSTWEGLHRNVGFDLEGVLRRRALVPFVLIPRRVARESGNSERSSLLNKLHEAHDAFVFGSPLAALALMRATMEVVLKDHYRAQGGRLKELIQSVGDRLPAGASVAALHRLRETANRVLHSRQERFVHPNELGDLKFEKLDDKGLEKEIVSLLLVLRALIEGVK